MKFILLSHSCPIKDDFAHTQRLMFLWNFNGESLTSVWSNQQSFDYCRLSTSWERPLVFHWGLPRGAAGAHSSCTQRRTGTGLSQLLLETVDRKTDKLSQERAPQHLQGRDQNYIYQHREPNMEFKKQTAGHIPHAIVFKRHVILGNSTKKLLTEQWHNAFFLTLRNTPISDVKMWQKSIF